MAAVNGLAFPKREVPERAVSHRTHCLRVGNRTKEGIGKGKLRIDGLRVEASERFTLLTFSGLLVQGVKDQCFNQAINGQWQRDCMNDGT